MVLAQRDRLHDDVLSHLVELVHALSMVLHILRLQVLQAYVDQVYLPRRKLRLLSLAARLLWTTRLFNLFLGANNW